MKVRSTALFLLLLLFTVGFSLKPVEAVCGDNIVDPGEQCDSTAVGGCCLTTCLNATSSSVINTSPSTLSVTIAASANTYLTAAQLQLVTSGTNYPLSYSVVNAVPSSTTWPPRTRPVFTYDNTLNRLNFVNGWAGTYIVTIASPYCTATNGSLIFTRSLVDPAYGTCSTSGMSNTQVFCAASTGTYARSRCDCSLQTCRKGYSDGSCAVGYTTCAQACPDILAPKPVSFTIQVGRSITCVGAASGCSTTPSGCTCPAICGDFIIDTNETCDAGPGGCCSNTCTNTTTPTTTIAASASMTVASNANQTLSALQLTGTSNYPYTIQIVSVTGLAGVTATMDSTYVYFNTAFTGTVTATFNTVYCAAKGQQSTFVRTITMNSCGNSVTDPGEECDNYVAGGCCLANCTTMTASNVYNLSPDILSYTIPASSNTYVTSNDVFLAVTNANYPTFYSIVNVTPSSTTYTPVTPPVFSYDNTLLRLNFVNGWAGTYILVFVSTYCSATNGSLYFTRYLTINSYGSCRSGGIADTEVYCSTSSAVSSAMPRSRCDCSVQACRTAYNDVFPGVTCYTGYTTCSAACADVRSPKPVSFSLRLATQRGSLCQAVLNCGSTSNIGCTCNAVCGDGIQDTAEYCDLGSSNNQVGSCCTSNCLAPAMPYPLDKSLTLSTCTASVVMTGAGLNLTGLTSNVPLSYTILNVSGVPGVGASMTATTFTFNTTFTGTVLVYISSVYCSTTGDAYIFTRTITSPSCCGNSVINPGEDCDLGTGVNGVSTNCCSSTCSYVPSSSNQVCRASAGPCDLAETCSGTSSTCPTNILAPSTTICRNVSGVCDRVEFCTGSATTCPADTFLPSGTICRNTTDLCDTAATCNGASITCPVNGFAVSTVVCRASAGLCDPQETCTGSAYACPANIISGSTVQCRASAGVCDPAEFCIFGNASCPANAFLSSTTPCRTAVSVCDATEFCTGLTALCPTDVYQPSGTVCRTNVSVCDVAEVCNGITTACPADAFSPSTVTCRASAGICDPEEKCTGSSSACPANVFSPATTQCRASAGVCDAPEFCIFNNASCPSDSYYNTSTVCRAASGGCDAIEYCTGLAITCPVDSYQANGFVCRPVADVCDVAETCSGSSPACPVDAFKQNTIICRNQSGLCDIADYCTGSAAACPVDSYAPSGTICRPTADFCDSPESCDGSTPTCPADGYLANGTVCRSSAGICDQAEVCSGLSIVCPTNVFLDSSNLCGPSQGACDPPEYCSGSSALCPTNILTASGVVCNTSSGSCEGNALCDGSTATCPPKSIFSSSVVCRSSGGLCDLVEQCDGSNPTCPPNIFRPSSYICSASTGACMADSYCSGSSALCTILPFYNSSVICRPSIGNCDVDEYCTGSAAACPSDTVLPGGYVCDVQTSDNTCKVNTTCSGLSGVCTPTYLSAGASCRFDSNYCFSDTCAVGPNSTTVCVRGLAINYDDGLYCNGVETCNPSTGLIIAGTPVICNDGSSCTTDSCSNSLAMCVTTPVANSVGPCGGGLGACTPGNYSCVGTGPSPVITCVGAVQPVTEICFNGIDDNCNGQVDEFCTGLPCNTTQDCLNGLNLTQCLTANCTLGQCLIINKNSSVLCNDGKKCTVNDHCDGLGSCVSTPIVCNDQNPCTQDSCSEVYGQCVFNTSTNVGLPCTSDNLCATQSSCNAQGQCIVDSVIGCSSTSECAAQECNPSTGLCEDADLTGKPCQLGSVCNLNGVCVDGQGCVTAPRICDDFIPCTVDTCIQRSGDPCSHSISTGTCLIEGQCYSSGDQKPFNPCFSCQPLSSASSWTPTSGSLSCDDGNLCTLNDICSFGVCTGTPINCSAQDTQCSESFCDRGVCQSQPANIGDSCSDGLACTSGDTCNNVGECMGIDLNCAQFSTQCTVFTCSESGSGCVAEQIVDYTRCYLDSDACNGNEYCLSGVCVQGDALACTSNDVCLLASCNSSQGCVLTPRTNSVCDDFNVCTLGDACGSDGLCYPGSGVLNCDDGNPCTYDQCDSVLGCINTPLASCTTCTIDSDCDSTACQETTCIAGTCTYNALLAGTSCGVSSACSRNDYCTDSGVCVTLVPERCEDNNVCTTDSCTQGLGCVFAPLTGDNCDDDDVCTNNDECQNGVCAGTPITCPASTDCLDYVCQAISGLPVCVAVPRNINGPCFDGGDLCQVNGRCSSNGLCKTVNVSCPLPSECTPEYSCSGGVCTPHHLPLGSTCNRGDLCTPWSCNGAGSCLANTSATKICPFNALTTPCQLPPVCIPYSGECYPQFYPDGTSCNDNNLCTDNDHCHAGTCLGDDYYPCTLSPPSDCMGPPLCDPLSGCYRLPLPDGEPCYTNDGCSTLSTCVAGACSVPLLSVPCVDDVGPNDDCTLYSCLQGSGCQADITSLNGVACSLDNACYNSGVCASGLCTATTTVTCSDALSCHTSYCSPEDGCLLLAGGSCSTCAVASDCPYLPCKSASCPAGTCQYTSNNAATAGCNDNLFCNGEETCSQGTCILGVPPSCLSTSSCTVGSCDETSNTCVQTPRPVNSTCTSEDKCALSSRCDGSGNCVVNTRAPCTFTEPCRVSQGCNALTGGCSSTILPDGTVCVPNDPCAGPATCQNGVCSYSTTMDCSTLEANFCSESYVCNRQTGLCEGNDYSPRACSDTSACTLGDYCSVSGICMSGIYDPCEFTVYDDQCQSVSCDINGACLVSNHVDGDVCSTGMQVGVCSGTDACSSGACVRNYSPGTLCNQIDSTGCDAADYCVLGNDYCPTDNKQSDGTACTPTEYCASAGACSDGACMVSAPRDCTSFDSPCTTGVCDENLGACVARLRPNNEACQSPDLPCVEHSGCYFDSCLPYSAPASTNCSDDNECTSADHCSGVDDTCVSGSVVTCTPPSANDAPCLSALCNATTGSCEFQAINEGGPCNADDNFCTTGDSCQSGVCVAGPGMDCSYLDSPCQRGVCTSTTTCGVEILGRACSPDYCEGNCTAPHEWWSRHSSHEPAGGLFTWPGNYETQVLCGSSYYNWALQPYDENSWLALFQQWLAASLNQQNGACMPNTTNTALGEAFTLLSACQVDSVYFTNSTAAPYRDLLYTIYAYNSGVNGPGLCDPSYCFNDETATANCLYVAVPYI